MSRRALLVGVGEYANDYKRLRTPPHNVKVLAELLRKNPGDWTDVKTLTDPTFQSLHDAVHELFAGEDVAAQPATTATQQLEDVVLFYFSGHGDLRGMRDSLALITVDSEKSRPYRRAYKVAELRDLIQSCTTKCIILIFDCCFSGHGIQAVAMGGADTSPALDVFQANLTSGRGKFIVSSSGPLEHSWELPEDPHTFFTKYLIEAIDGLKGDADGNGVLTLREAFTYAEARMKADSRVEDDKRQVPSCIGFDVTIPDVTLCTRVGAPPRTKRSHTSIPPAAIPDVRAHLEEPTIPILGLGLYGSGPLSDHEISRALNEIIEANTESLPAGSVAESAEIVAQERGEDLHHHLIEIIHTQAEQAQAPGFYTILRRLDKVQLIVSCTYDLELEKSLKAANKPFRIVTHVLQHADNSVPEDSRETLFLGVVEPGKNTCRMASPTDLELMPKPQRGVVIYKLLGSPLLSELFDDPLASTVRTTVITESAHIKLHHMMQRSAIPEPFSRVFKRDRKLFIGYKMDTWNYRLAANLLRQQDTHENATRRGRMLAVRDPAHGLETVCWKQIGAVLLRMDPESFAHGAAALLDKPRRPGP